jgi:NADH dehydrogenase
MQGAKHVAKQLTARVQGEPADEPFRYFDKGSMATVSRFHAVAAIGPLRLKGFLAWLIWLVIHLVYLIGFKNRVTALLHWTVSFIGRGRSERTATLQQVLGRRAMEKMREADSNHWAGLGPLERDLFDPARLEQPDITRQG